MPFMENKNLLGRLGEENAARYLKQRGYAIIARNYRHLKAEIDLIARKGDTLAIVEVKTRTGNSLQSVMDAVNRNKRNRLIKAADHFIVSHELEVDARFDIIWVTRDKEKLRLEHIKNAFYAF